MTEWWLERSAASFWTRLGGPLPYPRDLEPALSLGFPVWCMRLPNLSTGAVERWLGSRLMPFHFACRDRELHGCIVAMRGRAIIFLSADDPSAIRRFTVAHEAAHFLLDYDEPRRQAIAALGPGIEAVLDGDRPPSPAEAIDARLGRVALGVYVDMMARGEAGAIELGAVLRSEQRADRLALELLAPAAGVLRRTAFLTSSPHGERLPGTVRILVESYGLPHGVAEVYAGSLLGPATRRSAREWLRTAER
jgi:hypothetical protein